MRHEMIRRALTRLSIADFATLVANIEGATKQVPENGTVAERAVRLIEWTESHGGPGLDEVERVAEDVLTEFEAVSTAGPVFLVPHRRNPYFAGREAELEQLHRTLNDVNRAALGQAISGLGGIGKTQTAVAYAYKYRDEYQAVLWVNAKTTEQLTSGLAGIAVELGLRHDPADEEDGVRATRHWLKSNDSWLLVMDNVDEPELVEPFLPVDVKGHVLLTSRASVFDMLGIDPLKLDVLSTKEAVSFLFMRTKRDNKEKEELQAAEDLAREVGYLPLALEQAAAYILAMQVSLAKYLKRYRKQPLTMLEMRGPVAGRYPKSVATTWAVNFGQLGKAQQDVLRLSAFLAPDRIPLDVIAGAKSLLGEAISSALEDEDSVHELVEPLRRFSLIDLDAQSETYSIHRLVQCVTQDDLDEKSCTEWIEKAIVSTLTAFQQCGDVEWAKCERFVSHANVACSLTERFAISSPAALLGTAFLSNKIGLYFTRRGKYSNAEPLYKQALDITRDMLGENHSQFGKSCFGLGELYQLMGRCDEAETLLTRALGITRSVSDGEHESSIATISNKLAALHRMKGQYDEAEPLYRDALEIFERLGNHIRYSQVSHNLAELYDAMGRHEDAEPIYKKALTSLSAIVGEDSPEYARCCQSLAKLYLTTKQYEECEPLASQSLSALQLVLGEEHPDFADACNTLGLLYCDMGRFDEAEPLIKQALESFRSVVGDEHLSSLNCYNSLAALYMKAGSHDQAEPILRRAIEVASTALGADHPTTTIVKNNYTQLLKEWVPSSHHSQGDKSPESANLCTELANQCIVVGNAEGAEQFFKQAIETRRALLGEQHPEYGESCGQLAGLYFTMGRHKDALPLVEQALEVRRGVFGEQHISVAGCNKQLGDLHYQLGQYSEAETAYRNALEIYRELGERDSSVAFTCNNLAMLYQNTDRLDEAESLHKQAVAIATTALGPDHPDTAFFRANHKQLQEEPVNEPIVPLGSDRCQDIKSVAPWQSVLGEEHPGGASTLDMTATANRLLCQGKHDEAERVLSRCVALATSMAGENSSNHAIACSNLASLYEVMGRKDVAEPLYRNAIETLTDAFGFDFPTTAAIRDHYERFLKGDPAFAENCVELAQLYLQWGRFEEAESLYEHACSLPGDEDSDWRAQCSLALGQIYVSTNRRELADPLFDLVTSRIRMDGGGLTLASWCQIVGCIYKSVDVKKAELNLREAMDIRRGSLGEEHPDFGETCYELGELLKSCNRVEEASQLYEQALLTVTEVTVTEEAVAEKKDSLFLKCMSALSSLNDHRRESDPD